MVVGTTPILTSESVFLTQPINVTLKSDDTFQAFIIVMTGSTSCDVSVWIQMGNCNLTEYRSDCHSLNYSNETSCNRGIRTFLFNVTMNQDKETMAQLFNLSEQDLIRVSFHDQRIASVPSAYIHNVSNPPDGNCSPCTVPTPPDVNCSPCTVPTPPDDNCSDPSPDTIPTPPDVVNYICCDPRIPNSVCNCSSDSDLSSAGLLFYSVYHSWLLVSFSVILNVKLSFSV